MKKSAQRICLVLGAFICLGIVARFTKDFWRDQLHAYFLGRVEVTAEHFQHLPEDIDTVEIFALAAYPHSEEPDYKNGF